MRQAMAVLSVLALAALPVAGHAQAQPAPGDSWVDITGDKAEYDTASHTAVYKGNVEALDTGGARLISDVLDIFMAKDAPAAPSKAKPSAAPSTTAVGGSVEKLIAEGHVFYVTPDQTAAGDHAVYEAASGTIVMTGNVVLKQGDNVLTGDKVTVNMATNHAELDSNAQGRNVPGRVRGVFYNARPAPGLATVQPGHGG